MGMYAYWGGYVRVGASFIYTDMLSAYTRATIGAPSLLRSTLEVPSPRLIVFGENLASHWPTAKGGGLRTGSGTSFATPVAVAIAALILAFVNQDISEDHRKKALIRAMAGYLDRVKNESYACVYKHSYIGQFCVNTFPHPVEGL